MSRVRETSEGWRDTTWLAVGRRIPTPPSKGIRGGSGYRNPETGAMIVGQSHQMGTVAFGQEIQPSPSDLGERSPGE